MKPSQINSAPIGPKDVSGLVFKRFLSLIPLPLRLSLIWKGLNLLCRLRLGSNSLEADHSPTQSGDLIVSGFFNESLGVGRAGSLTHLALLQAGYRAQAKPLRHLFSQILSGKASLGEAGGVWLIHANAPEAMIALLAYDKTTWQHRYRIGYWAWETPEIPKDWVYACRYFHEIWVPSQYVLEAIANALKRTHQEDQLSKLKLMPHPVAINSLATPDRNGFGLSKQGCEVLSLFDCDSSVVRKNPWATVMAWLRAFERPNPSAHLTLKISGKTNRSAVLTRLKSICAGRNDISLVESRLEDQRMDQFISSFDVLISLHRSEGFGLSLAEAMRAGLVVIATEGSGNSDFMTSENSILIPSQIIPINDQKGPYSLVSGPANQVWAEPDIEAAASALRQLASNLELGQRLSEQAKVGLAHLPASWEPSALKSMKFNNYL